MTRIRTRTQINTNSCSTEPFLRDACRLSELRRQADLLTIEIDALHKKLEAQPGESGASLLWTMENCHPAITMRGLSQV